MMSLHDDRLLILDFGSQYTQLIARRVREQGVYSEILPCDVDPSSSICPKGVILSGGQNPPQMRPDGKFQSAYDLNVPLLGICYGMQALAQGSVAASIKRFTGLVTRILSLKTRVFTDGVSNTGSLSVDESR